MHNLSALSAAAMSAQKFAARWQGLTYRAIYLKHFANFATAQPLFWAKQGRGQAGSGFFSPDVEGSGAGPKMKDWGHR
jgi:hypothetical protein